MRIVLIALSCSLSVGANAFSDSSYESEVNCLAENIYHEARGQSIAGRLAVAHVTINRVIHKRFPDTVCGVVRQGKTKISWKTGQPVPVKNKCQFSWFCDGKKDIINEPKAWYSALNVAHSIYFHRIETAIQMIQWGDTTEGAMWYHAARVTPYWASSMHKVKHVNNHIFYNKKGT